MSDQPRASCPRDGATLQTDLRDSGIEIDVCSVCGGIWLDKGELEALIEELKRTQGDAPASQGDSVRASFEQARQEGLGPIKCPRCAADADPREYMFFSQVLIDTCPNGCGSWLDKGELEAIHRFVTENQLTGSELGAPADGDSYLLKLLELVK